MSPCYNLRRHPNLFNAMIDPTIIPGIHIKIPEYKYANSLTAANHALQLWQLQLTMNEKPPDEKFAGTILDGKNRKSLDFCHLIKLDKYRFIWMKSFSNELGRLTQGIHEISGTNTIDFIPYS